MASFYLAHKAGKSNNWRATLMPAVSQSQQRLMALAEHNPDALYKRNQGVLKMSMKQLHDFAATGRKGLPKKVKKSK